MSVSEFFDDTKDVGPRNIPSAKYIEDVGGFIGDREPSAIVSLARQLLERYQIMDRSLRSQRDTLKEKIPEITDALNAVNLIQKQNAQLGNFEEGPLGHVRYKLSQTIYADAKIPKTDTVGLWLGANIMLEYPVDEAERLLEKNLSNALKTTKELNKELLFLKHQQTMTEVNIARLHNYGISLQKSKKEGK